MTSALGRLLGLLECDVCNCGVLIDELTTEDFITGVLFDAKVNDNEGVDWSLCLLGFFPFSKCLEAGDLGLGFR